MEVYISACFNIYNQTVYILVLEFLLVINKNSFLQLQNSVDF